MLKDNSIVTAYNIITLFTIVFLLYNRKIHTNNVILYPFPSFRINI